MMRILKIRLPNGKEIVILNEVIALQRLQGDDWERVDIEILRFTPIMQGMVAVEKTI